VKKEVAERWKRGERQKRENRGAVEEGGHPLLIPLPVGHPLPNRLGGLGERREPPQRGPPGQSPGRKRIWCILWPLEGR